MKSKWILPALALLVSLPALAQAQERQRPRGPATVGGRAFSFAFNRGRIGVLVKTEADSQTDKIGARIDGVTAGGPAEKAGIKVGDIVTGFNGVSLAGADAEDADRSGPGLKLVRLAQALDPGDTVRVEYRRGTDNRTATLVAEEIEASWEPGREFQVVPEIKLPGEYYDLGDHMRLMIGGAWGNLDLVNLNAELGEYFGTQEGVLVVRTSSEGDLPLKGGDVILSIDGRKPSSPAHAMRILRSYDEGESVKIDVMRKQKRLTLTWTVPSREERVRGVRRRAPQGERT